MSAEPTPDAAATADPPQQPPPRQKAYNNLYVQGLHQSVTDSALEAWFKPFGEIRSAKVMLNVRTGASRGFGFVLFANEEDGRRAAEALNGKVLVSSLASTTPPPQPQPEDGEAQPQPTLAAQAPPPPGEAVSTLSIAPSEHDGDQAVTESTVIYLRNIPSEVTEEQAMRLCRRHGRVTSFAMAPILPRHGRRKDKQRQAAAAAAAANTSTAAGAADGDAAPAMGASPDAGRHELDAMGAFSFSEGPGGMSQSQAPGGTLATASHYLATVEFETVEEARKAIGELHQTKPWPSCTIPLLAKFADTEQLREYRVRQRKARQALQQKRDAETKDGETPPPAAEAEISSPERRGQQPAASHVDATGPGVLRNKPDAKKPTNRVAKQTSPAPALPVPRVAVGAMGLGVGMPAAAVGVVPSPYINAATAAAAATVPPPVPNSTSSPQAAQPQTANAGGMPAPQAGSVIYYRGTLKANADGTYSMLQPEAINFQGVPDIAGAAMPLVMPYPSMAGPAVGGSSYTHAPPLPPGVQQQFNSQQHGQQSQQQTSQQQQQQQNQSQEDRSSGATPQTQTPQQTQTATAPSGVNAAAMFPHGSFANSLVPMQPTLYPVTLGQSVGGTQHHMYITADQLASVQAHQTGTDNTWAPAQGAASLGSSMPAHGAATQVQSPPSNRNPTFAVGGTSASDAAGNLVET